jgi:hypothetical protein
VDGMRLQVLAVLVGLAVVPVLRADCGRRSFCDFHKEYADDTGEDRYLSGVHHRVYRHSIAEKDETTGTFKTHEILERCDPEPGARPAEGDTTIVAPARPTPTPRLECPKRAQCDFHHEMGDDTGQDEYSGDIHYRTYSHSLAETDEQGRFKQHEFKLRCD